MIESAIGINSSVDEKPVAVIVPKGEGSDPIDVSSWEVCGPRCSVTLKGRIRTICQPVEFSIRTFKRREEQILVITAEANDLVWRPFLEVHKKFDDTTAVQASIDVVTKEDEGRLLRRGVLLTAIDEPLKLI